MEPADMDAVSTLSDAVHGQYTEPRAVYAERRALYPAGCFVLADGADIAGYLIAHPWRHEAPPPLGGMIEAIPADADCFYLHDLALLRVARGTGAGGTATRMVLELAKQAGLGDVFLLAVGGADVFWASRGFAAVADAPLAARLTAAYGPDVLYMHRPAR
ncbi:GNAT family N-acetyltransferase [Croceibacterium xixiisoli]|nr:GNAT family N-acetyltransferase [Croceibacterium xixiisoli]